MTRLAPLARGQTGGRLCYLIGPAGRHYQWLASVGAHLHNLEVMKKFFIVLLAPLAGRRK